MVNHTCSICSIPFEDDDQDEIAVECEQCETWFHAQCVNLGDLSIEEINNTSWLCESCKINDTICPYCPKMCKGTKGVGIHISKSHKDKQNAKIANRYIASDINLHDNAADETDSINLSVNNSTKYKALDEFNAQINALHIFMTNNEIDTNNLDNTVDEFINILKQANMNLPGPKHPAAKHIQARQNKSIFQNNPSFITQSSNPMRTSKRAREKRRERYNYKLYQHLYYFQRRKCVKNIENDSYSSCNISMENLHQSFSDRWSSPNMSTLPEYRQIDPHDQQLLDNDYSGIISPEDIKASLKKLRNDSSPGIDNIYPKTLKMTISSEIMADIATAMLKLNYVPISLRTA